MRDKPIPVSFLIFNFIPLVTNFCHALMKIKFVSIFFSFHFCSYDILKYYDIYYLMNLYICNCKYRL
jgi:hypothetical protein